MSSSTDSQLLKREDLPDAKGEWVDKIIQPINSNTAALAKIQGAQNGITSLSNSKPVGPLQMTHGVELRVKNPLGTAAPLTVIVADCDGLPISSSVKWRRINSETQPDQLGLTVFFDAPIGAAHFTRNAAQSMASGSTEVIVWDATDFLVGDGIARNGLTVDFAYDGLVQFSYQMAWASGTGGRGSWIQNTVGSVRLGSVGPLTPAAASTVELSGAQLVQVAAKTSYYLVAVQVSGAALNTNTGNVRPRISANYVGQSPAYKANVSFLILGQ